MCSVENCTRKCHKATPCCWNHRGHESKFTTVVKPVVEFVESVPETVVKPIVEPVVEPVAELVVDSVVKAVTEPVVGQSQNQVLYRLRSKAHRCGIQCI
ncbi:unnamed protein product [Phytophthora lilii]|uniref:Unnamed protein product n=1 Tax=Phytophthora lilii TaxID=2077276 RepID=A0A9W6TF77_9STRA|nr:unnamed protein product [Phytophthora lilii]